MKLSLSLSHAYPFPFAPFITNLVFSVEGRNLLLNAFLALFIGKLDLLVLQGSMSSRSLLFSLLGNRVGTDGFVGLGVHGFQAVSSDASLDEAAELTGIALGFVFLKLTHVIGNVTTENVLAHDFSVKGILGSIETGETLFAVGNVQTTINGTLQGSEALGTSAGTSQTNVQDSLESAGTVFFAEFSLIEAELVQGTTSAQQTSAVDGSVVSQTNLDTESGELVSISSSNDDITLNLGVHDLADDIGVGDADDEAVLGGVVLVLVLDDQALASIVISLSLTTATILDLVAFEVSFILLDLDERLHEREEN